MTLARALEYHRQGRLAEAARLYEQLLEQDDRNPDAWNLLGLVSHAQGDHETARQQIERAIALSPDFADYHNNLATVRYAVGDFAGAEASCRTALDKREPFPQAHNNLGNTLAAQGKWHDAIASYERAVQLDTRYANPLAHAAHAWQQLEERGQARDCCRRALAIDPRCVEAWNQLGNAELAEGRIDRAVDAFQQALDLRPDSALIWNNLGNACRQDDRRDDAVACYRRALELDPRLATAWHSLAALLREAGRRDELEQCLAAGAGAGVADARLHNDLGELLWQKKEWDAARDCFHHALELEPRWATPCYNLGNACREQQQLDEAEDWFRAALERDPGRADAATNLAITLGDQGRAADALRWFDQAHLLDPSDARAHSHLLVCRQFQPGSTLSALRAGHQRWDELHAAPFAPNARHAARRSVRRVGLVSRDLRRHPVGYFLVGVLEALVDREIEVIAYADQTARDAMTERLAAACDHWHQVAGATDEALGARIARDEIDVLIDLAGHTAGHRLLVFARRPAPRQLTWMGYVGTTGMRAMDGLISDRFHTPEGVDAGYVESVMRMPHGYVAYAPPADAPEVSEPPCRRSGGWTFGCFHNPAKLSAPTLARWARVLDAVPRSRLFLKFHGWESRRAQHRVLAELRQHGIDADRIRFEGGAPHHNLLAAYRDVDLALDTLPYSGGLTTCEALWMGVPVVTMPGATFAGRHALSHLSNAGLGEFVTGDEEAFIATAAAWADSPDRLAALRGELRERVAASPLCDAERFAGDFEALLQTRCAGAS